jgi:hypothetical protein
MNMTLVPRGKSGQFAKKVALTTTAPAPTKSPLDTFKASGIGDRMRRQYTATFAGDPITTLSDDYLMRIYNEVRAANPGANDVCMWEENGENNGCGLLCAAMAQAEADPQEISAINITASDVRSSAHDAAAVLSHDKTYAAIQGSIVEAERTRKQAPAQLAWTLERLYVRKDTTGKVLCNMIEGTGPEFDDSKRYPWPILGTKEKDSNGNTVNNPDIMMKFRGNKQVPVSFYGEVIRDTPRGAELAAEEEQYKLATAKVPTGKYADQTSPDYCDAMTAEKKADECKSDIDTMVKSLKRAVSVLRQMWAVNEMAAPNSPPRCIASFRVEKKWNPNKISPEGHKGGWDDDPTKLARMDSPIVVHDKISNETATFRVGEFLSHDTVAAGKAGGTISDFRKAIKAKRKGGSGTGKNEESKEKDKTVLVVSDLDRAIASVATSFETPAANGNYWRFLNGKPEDTDASLQSVFNIARQIMAGLAAQPDLRARLALLEHSPLADINAQVGVDRVSQASENATRLKTRHVA